MPAHCDKGITNDKIHGLSSTVKRKLEVTQYSFEIIQSEIINKAFSSTSGRKEKKKRNKRETIKHLVAPRGGWGEREKKSKALWAVSCLFSIFLCNL